jgi:hypothetical protein
MAICAKIRVMFSRVQILMLASILLFLGCKSGENQASVSDPSVIVPATPTPVPPASGQIVLDGCLGLSGVNEKCTLVTNASACVSSKCSKLVVIFSGGEMGCISGPGYANALSGYASNGWAAVCINYFDTSTGSGDVPYVDEASRLDYAVQQATSGAWANAYWTGEKLLLQGISHGATAPVILMARTSLAQQAHWQGTQFTAGCFFDGSYNQLATANLLSTGALGGGPCITPVSYFRGLERYCGPGANGSNCVLASKPKALDDTITNLATVNFAVHDFKMFECGSAGPVCTKDIIPGVPVQDLCNDINNTSGYSCSFTSLPDDGHLTCHGNEYDRCRTWFESIAP